jgi:hypothetical protein
VIPGVENPQSWNRYSYVGNSPIHLSDPSGHKACDDENDCQGTGSSSSSSSPTPPIPATSGGNKHPKPGPRSQLVHDYDVFTEIPWNPYPNPSRPLDWRLLQNYCNRKYGSNVECGVYQRPLQAPNGININIDAFGIRIEGSIWMGGGGDLNIDLLYFGRSNQFGLFVSPGGQAGEGGGSDITGGILIAQNTPDRESYAGPSYTIGGTDVPVIPLGINVEGDYSVSSPNADGSIPKTTYMGVGPLSGEAGTYSGSNYSVSVFGLWDWLTGK